MILSSVMDSAVLGKAWMGLLWENLGWMIGPNFLPFFFACLEDMSRSL